MFCSGKIMYIQSNVSLKYFQMRYPKGTPSIQVTFCLFVFLSVTENVTFLYWNNNFSVPYLLCRVALLFILKQVQGDKVFCCGLPSSLLAQHKSALFSCFLSELGNTILNFILITMQTVWETKGCQYSMLTLVASKVYE